MKLVLITNMSLWMTFLSNINDSILPSIGVTYHIEYAMAGLKYFTLDTNPQVSMNWTSMVLFSLRVYGEDENSTM